MVYNRCCVLVFQLQRFVFDLIDYIITIRLSLLPFIILVCVTRTF